MDVFIGRWFYQFQETIEQYHAALCVQSPARHHSEACYRFFRRV